MKPFARLGAALAMTGALAASHEGAHALAQMHKCVEAGRTVYQQQACAAGVEADSAASATAHVASRPEGAAPAASAARRVRVSSPASSAPATPR